jgi:ABC-2 type transport system permease protein
MMRWRRMAAIALRYFYLLRGRPARVVPLFAWVGIDIVLWGFISRYLNSVASAGLNFIPLCSAPFSYGTF